MAKHMHSTCPPCDLDCVQRHVPEQLQANWLLSYQDQIPVPNSMTMSGGSKGPPTMFRHVGSRNSADQSEDTITMTFKRAEIEDNCHELCRYNRIANPAYRIKFQERPNTQSKIIKIDLPKTVPSTLTTNKSKTPRKSRTPNKFIRPKKPTDILIQPNRSTNMQTFANFGTFKYHSGPFGTLSEARLTQASFPINNSKTNDKNDSKAQIDLFEKVLESKFKKSN